MALPERALIGGVLLEVVLDHAEAAFDPHGDGNGQNLDWSKGRSIVTVYGHIYGLDENILFRWASSLSWIL